MKEQKRLIEYTNNIIDVKKKRKKKITQWIEKSLELAPGKYEQKDFCKFFGVKWDLRHNVKNNVNDYFLKRTTVPLWWKTHYNKAFEKLTGMNAYIEMITFTQKSQIRQEIRGISREKGAARLTGITPRARQTALQIADVTERSSNQRLHRLNRLELLKSIKEELEQIESIKQKLLK